MSKKLVAVVLTLGLSALSGAALAAEPTKDTKQAKPAASPAPTGEKKDAEKKGTETNKKAHHEKGKHKGHDTSKEGAAPEKK